jgi:threonine aldolase
VKAALRDPNNRNAPRSRLVSVENTSNGGFGTVWPLATLQGVEKVARAAGVAMHMDGARLCNAAVKSGTKAKDYAACVDFDMDRLHQGTGRTGRRLAGGLQGLHQGSVAAEADAGRLDAPVGVIAAAALYALEHNWDRLAEDHDNAHRLAAASPIIKGLDCEVERMQTNLVFFEVKKPGWTAAKLVEACKERGVGLGANTATRIPRRDASRRQPWRHRHRAKVINDVMAA